MWSRSLFLFFCAFVFVNSSPQSFGGERETFPNSQGGFGGSDGSFRPNNQNVGFGGNNEQYGNNRPSTSGSNTIARPEGTQQSGGDRGSNFGTNNPETSFSRPSGGFSQSTDNRPTGGFSNTGSSFPQGGQNRPVGGSGNNYESSFSRPTGSGQTNNFQQGQNFGSQSGRPIDQSNYNQQTGFTPDHQLGGNNQRPGSSQQSGQNQFSSGSEYGGQNQFTGSGQSGQNQFSSGTGQSGQNQFPSGSGQNGQYPSGSESGSSNKENEREDKEEEKDVCFGNLGCFKMGKPWKSALRPIGAPYGPEKIQTTLFFYSRQNPLKQINITMHPQIDMRQAPFDPTKITAIIVHGFSNSGNATWMKDMKDVYLKKVDANVMIVDWGKGAQLLNYLQVAGNTRVVGKQLGVFVQYLIDNYRADPGKFHLIGHSLGAQICSYLGKEVKGIARLTALDPAQPGFEGFDSQIRLDKTDAEFVDVIHTDARPFIPTLGFGMIAPHGHVDFYMNGGFDQPGCVPPAKKELPSIKSFLDFAKYPVEVIAKIVACPHARAYEYLIESFNETDNCIFWGHKADVKNVFKSVTNTVTQGLLKKLTTLSPTCSKEDCIPVGFATKKSPLRGVFVVTTNGRSPYCISEPGIPPETPPQERKQESFIQKIGRKTGLI